MIKGIIWKKDDAKFVGILYQNAIYICIKDMERYAKYATIKFFYNPILPFIIELFVIKTYNNAYIF